ncbi:MAG: glycosyl transferase family 1 [Bacteroidota bacterium]
MTKKIILISQTESHLTKRGKRHPNLADYLSSKGYDLDYYSSSFYHAEKIQFTSNQVIQANKELGYRLHIIKSLSYFKNVGIRRILSNLQFSRKVYKELKSKDLDNSIIIVPSRPVEIIYFIAKLKRGKNIKVLVDIRDVWPDAFNIQNKFLKKGFEAYCNFFLKNSLNHFDSFIYTCPKFTDWLHRFVPGAEASFIPLGYDRLRFSKVQLKTKDSGFEPINFVYIGLLQHQIEVLPFVKAINNDERFSLTLYGDDGEGAKYAELVQYIEKEQVTNVTLKGKLPQEKVGEILNNYDIGLMPMKAKFAFPNKVFDYIALCLPIFSLGDHDTSIFVRNNNIGWVSTFEVDEIKEILEGIYTSRDKDILKYSERLAELKEDYARDNLYEKYLVELEK